MIGIPSAPGGIPSVPEQKQIIARAATKFGISPSILWGLYGTETSFGHNVTTSSAGAVGPFQFEPGTARSMGVNPYDFESAAFGAAKYLSQYKGRGLAGMLSAYNAGPAGGLQPSYVHSVLQNARSWGGAAPGIGAKMAQSHLGGRTNGISVTSPGVTNTGPSSTTDYADALVNSMLSNPVTVSSTGRISVPNILGDALNSAVTTYNAPTTTIGGKGITSTLPGTGKTLRGGSFHGSLSKGDTNPLGSGWTLGRTDMGVDANAAPGTPIHALNDSKVVQIMPNWYAGQPLVLMQILSGPNAGKYWYVAEQISQHLRIGQVILKGHTVATYAPSGTGIEIGWGSPKSSQRTLAGATTGYTEGQVTPAGANFRNTELR